MKAKKIGIAHTGDFARLGAVKRLFTKLVEDLESDGRKLRFIREDLAVFEDGSTVSVFKGTGRGRKHTHLYIDKGFLELENGWETVETVFITTVLPNGNYEHLDVEDNAIDRTFFIKEDGNIEPYKI